MKGERRGKKRYQFSHRRGKAEKKKNHLRMTNGEISRDARTQVRKGKRGVIYESSCEM